jgi:hypothetical protein
MLISSVVILPPFAVELFQVGLRLREHNRHFVRNDTGASRRLYRLVATTAGGIVTGIVFASSTQPIQRFVDIGG